jgi:ribosomal protein L40E
VVRDESGAVVSVTSEFTYFDGDGHDLHELQIVTDRDGQRVDFGDLGWVWSEVNVWDCPVCETMADEWGADGCSCWWCRSCKATNPEGDNQCRSCHTSFCIDCACVIQWREELQGWDGDHVAGCFMAYRNEWQSAN